MKLYTKKYTKYFKMVTIVTVRFITINISSFVAWFLNGIFLLSIMCRNFWVLISKLHFLWIVRYMCCMKMFQVTLLSVIIPLVSLKCYVSRHISPFKDLPATGSGIRILHVWTWSCAEVFVRECLSSECMRKALLWLVVIQSWDEEPSWRRLWLCLCSGGKQ